MMGYLVAAFTLAWVGFFMYNFLLIRRIHRLERTLQDLTIPPDKRQEA